MFSTLFPERFLEGKSAKMGAEMEAKTEEKVRKIGVGTGVQKTMRRSVKRDTSK